MLSVDMDIVLDDISTVIGILEANGFSKIGKQYYSKEYDLLVEFVSGPAPARSTGLNTANSLSSLRLSKR